MQSIHAAKSSSDSSHREPTTGKEARLRNGKTHKNRMHHQPTSKSTKHYTWSSWKTHHSEVRKNWEGTNLWKGGTYDTRTENWKELQKCNYSRFLPECSTTQLEQERAPRKECIFMSSLMSWSCSDELIFSTSMTKQLYHCTGRYWSGEAILSNLMNKVAAHMHTGLSRSGAFLPYDTTLGRARYQARIIRIVWNPILVTPIGIARTRWIHVLNPCVLLCCVS